METTYRQHARARLWALLGDLPDTAGPPRIVARQRADTDEYRLERLTLDLNGLDEVPAFFVAPREGEGPWPCVVFSHSHGGYFDMGKRELLDGVSYRWKTPMAVELTRAGMAAICIDHWGFGGRQGRGELRIAMDMLWRGQVMWGMMLYDSIRAIDYLITRDDVRADRIGATGMSMGSTMTWWLAAADSRVRCCVDTCCLTEFHTFDRLGGFHAPFYYVPGLLKHFTTAQINALAAPRPHLSLAGEYDRLTPPEGLDLVDRELRKVYRDLDAAENWELKRYPVGHEETEEMRRETMAFLRRWLAG